MIIPSIDLQSGNAVQLIGGEKKAIDAGSPDPIARQFSLAGELAVIDLDAALGCGSNEAVIEGLVKRYACRVGGGIRTLAAAQKWLDRGAGKVILGTMAVPEILRQLPKERVIAALDARDGEVVVEGWTKGTGRTILDRIEELKDCVGGFLITFVEKEGRMGGTRLDLVEELVRAAAPARVTIAGGVTTAAEIAELDRMGADAQVGMALYSGRLSLAQCIAAPLRSDRGDGLWPTVVCDERGLALGLAWSSAESLQQAVESQSGVYYSRSRKEIWRKGATSGSTQELLAVGLDCDRDTVRFTVRQRGSGFCHTGTKTCFGEYRGISALEDTLAQRMEVPLEGSYTNRLFVEPGLLNAKILEESREFVDAQERSHVVEEGADLLYFLMVRLAARGIKLSEVETVLDLRSKKISRRPGDAKE